jgi:hypothetical protein
VSVVTNVVKPPGLLAREMPGQAKNSAKKMTKPAETIRKDCASEKWNEKCMFLKKIKTFFSQM